MLFRYFANHRRLQILELLKKEPELSVDAIAQALSMNYQTVSDHIRKLAIAGLVLKRYQGTNVLHKLTDRAIVILAFCKNLS